MQHLGAVGQHPAALTRGQQHQRDGSDGRGGRFGHRGFPFGRARSTCPPPRRKPRRPEEARFGDQPETLRDLRPRRHALRHLRRPPGRRQRRLPRIGPRRDARPWPDAEARQVALLGGRSMLRLGLSRLGPVDEAEVDRGYDPLLSAYDAAVCVHTAFYPAGAEATLSRLRGAGYALGICTNKPEALAVKLMGRARRGGRLRQPRGRRHPARPQARPGPVPGGGGAGGRGSGAVPPGRGQRDGPRHRARRGRALRPGPLRRRAPTRRRATSRSTPSTRWTPWRRGCSEERRRVPGGMRFGPDPGPEPATRPWSAAHSRPPAPGPGPGRGGSHGLDAAAHPPPKLAHGGPASPSPSRARTRSPEPAIAAARLGHALGRPASLRARRRGRSPPWRRSSPP